MAKKQKARVSHTVSFHVHYIRDEFNGTYRLWRSDMPNDVFDMVPINRFESEMLALAEMFPDAFVAGFPEDDAGELVCALCLEGSKS